MKNKHPVFIYWSACCNVQANKEACERTSEEMAAKEKGKHSLGTWNCPACGRKCKIARKSLTKGTEPDKI